MSSRFTPQFLDDIRNRLPVSALVGKRMSIKKAGAEWEGLSPFNKEKTPSFKVNDQKQMWHDFSSGRGGDIFKFLTDVEGLSFLDAVKQAAHEAGVPLPAGEKFQPKEPKKIEGPIAPAPPDDAYDDRRSEPKEKARRKIVSTYDYEDEQEHLLYQVVRFNWAFDDGSLDLNDAGKPKKTFGHRRPFRDEDGRWIWGMDAGEYMRKGAAGDWIKFDAENYSKWKYTERRRFTDVVEHGLYKLLDLKQAIADERTVFLCEGEKKADTCLGWNLAATTNSGGAKHFTERLASYFGGADVVVLVDNDDVGRQRGHTVAGLLRRAAAKRVRVLDLSQHWTDCPPKGDVSDWAQAGGTAEKLYEIAERTPDWSPEPPKSAFGAIRFVDLDLPAREHQWLIKGMLPRGGVVMTLGKWQSGKSFFELDRAITVAHAAVDPTVLYLGRRVIGGLVLYQAGEAGMGLKLRTRAIRQSRNIDPASNLPFVIMPESLNMYSSDDPVNKFIEEAKAWQAYYEMPLELIVIDTFSAATPGANENSSEHVSLILDRGNRINRALNATVSWVHHLNAIGDKARGHSSLMGNVDCVTEITETEKIDVERVGNSKQIERTVREAKIIKQKEEARGFRWEFVLKQVEISRDADGDPVTSCIVAPTGEQSGPMAPPAQPKKGRGQFLTDERVGLFQALLRALDDGGVPPPMELQLPATVSRVVEWGKFRYAYRKRVAPLDEDAKKHGEAIKKRLKRFQEFAPAAGIVAIESVGDVTYVWPTRKPVFGRGLTWPPAPPPMEEKQDEAPVDEATGDLITNI